MTTSAGIRSQWLLALRDQDSLQIMKLLERHSDLLKVGWGSETADIQWKGKPWKQRSALHVGVKRGNAKLVERVLRICNVVIKKETGNVSSATRSDRRSDASDRELTGMEEAHKNTNDKVSPSDIRGENCASTEDAQRVGRDSVLSFLRALAGKRRSNLLGYGESQEIACFVVARWKKRVEEGKIVRHKHQEKTFLRSLLQSKDDEYNLDATAMAALHGNPRIFLLLLYAMGACTLYDVSTDKLPPLDVIADSDENTAHKAKVREATKQFIKRFEPKRTIALCLEEYQAHLDFNFLPWREHLFHFSCHGHARKDFARGLWGAVKSWLDSPWRFLLELQDGQGRTALHIAVQTQSTASFLSILGEDEEALGCAMAASDGAGRTALHMALASGNVQELKELLKLATRFPEAWQGWEQPVRLGFINLGKFRALQVADELSQQNGFHGRARGYFGVDEYGGYWLQFSALQTAIVHKRVGLLHDLFSELQLYGDSGFWECWCLDSRYRVDLGGNGLEQRVDVMGLAALVGDANEVKSLLKMQEHKIIFSKVKPKSMHPGKLTLQAHHIAATFGNYEMLKAILDDPLCDPLIEDQHRNTALHHALNVETMGEFKPHLLDYVSCEHILQENLQKESEEPLNSSPLGRRQECIDLLLDAGLDVFKTNEEGQHPYPQGKLNSNALFVSWWCERKLKEVQAIKTTLSFASNVTTVAATLVAAASYVGPLQPPLGYAGDPSQIQDYNLWVRVFIFCNTMSFFFAILAITLSLLPSIPMPSYDWKDDVGRTRRTVALVVATMFPSIFFLLLAFISSSKPL